MMRIQWWLVWCASCGSSGGSHVTTPDGPPIGGSSCTLFPSKFIFNTPIDQLPPDGSSGTYITSLGGATRLHLDLGTQLDSTKTDYYGIPYNVVKGGSMTWAAVGYASGGAMDESDCGDTAHTVQSPCTSSPGQQPVPSAPQVEGGINSTPGDHHLIVLDTDACRLWENDASYRNGSAWTVYSSASWDLKSMSLRTAGWTSADAAGFPILPLLLRADEASSGTINHAVRFTINTSRTSYIWPARHEAGSTASTSAPRMGQLFRLKASYQIPASFGTQSKAILQALKTYGMYVADNGTDWYIQGAPSASWADATFTEVQMVPGSQFEAVDVTPIMSRAGFDVNSGAVP